MIINDYIKSIKEKFNSGISTEHSYRGDLQNLLLLLEKGITVTNEPKRQECGAPDYIIQKKDVPVGYIEAKNIGVDLDKIEKSEQMKRYLPSLDNLILTDYIEFRFFKLGQKIKEINLATIEKGIIKINSENFNSFLTYINDFCDFKGQTIKSAEKLAKIMADKARMMEEVLYNALLHESDDNSLTNQLEAFREILIHDLNQKEFADIYAQTIAYGLFAARLHDKTLDTFSREEALFLVPKSNPFLRQLFTYVAGPELDDRVVWIVNDLAEVFKATDLKEILKDFGNFTQQNDPFIHFYETFLAEYDPALRKSRGVYYTPEPVVNFIVRAVDYILKSEFNLPDGLADTSKIKIKLESHTVDGRNKSGFKMMEKDVHKVQILDPASGTGTFLSEIVKHIYKRFEGQEGIWSNYVEEHLLPRLNGFEILMAPYTMCHLKIEMLLKETGYKTKDEKREERLRVFLTNSLEEAHPDTGTLFASWLSNEAKEANFVKKNTPVMVVLGNPPYANFGQMNQGEWIRNLIADYKKDLNEKKINLDDDYIKYIRYGEYFIEKNGEGILAYISNNSFIDGITHRQMRKHLLATFDKIYILNLHGNAKKYEICPDGSKDENVFDIMQGVSINIFIKNNKKKKEVLGKVYHSEFYGLRKIKYGKLWENNINKIKWNELKFEESYYFFVPKDFSEKEYNSYISLDTIFLLKGPGCKTERDSLNIKITLMELENILLDFKNLSVENLRDKYDLLKDSRDWKVEWAKNDVLNNYSKKIIKYYLYRPFDIRYIFYSGLTKGFVGTPGYKRFFNMLKENIGIIFPRMCKGRGGFQHGFISKYIVDVACGDSFSGAGTFFAPLYLYPDDDSLNLDRTPNLNMEIVNKISEKLGLKFTPEKVSYKNTFSPIDILDYIYAVLHSPTYREKYKEFLKIDFPRIPYPENTNTFWKLVKLGGELRTIHLLENPIVEKFITTFPINGDNKVVKVSYENKKVWINKEQYFDIVSEIVWNFYIGGYQPAQKWLKDRKDRILNFDDIRHYQKIIVALSETDRLMKEIDKVIKI